MTPPALPPVAVTQGDPAGIGPEITLRAWCMRQEAGLPAFLALADPEILERCAAALGLDVPLAIVTQASEAGAVEGALPVLPLAHRAAVEPGRPSPESAAGTIEAIERAVTLAREGSVAAVVTNPIAKHVLRSAGFPHPGHTEFLAALAADGGEPPHPVMMLWSETLAVVPVTVHVPHRAVPDLLTAELIVRTGRIVARDLRERFGIPAPRLAVTGLNPHAGESGMLGDEDEAIIAPAIRRLCDEGIAAAGPYPADTLFHARARRGYDAALAMYHDQALIPLKTLAFDEGVNVTLGLPFIRTSPDHGTAFDIAGRGVARPDSLIAALRLAGHLAARQAAA